MKHPYVIPAYLVLIVTGCSSSPDQGQIPPRSDAPLTKEQQAILTQIEALPMDKRLNFVIQHQQDVMKMSAKSKTFGDRMAVDLPPTK